MRDAIETYPNDSIWELACEEAAKELYDELGREPTDEEVEVRADYLIQNSEPDWDAMIKDQEYF